MHIDTTLRPSPRRTCQSEVTAAAGEFHAVCALPAGHAGEHVYVDSMGLCRIDEHCRAMSSTWSTLLDGPPRNNGFAHNHA